MIEYLIVCEFFETQKGFNSLNLNILLYIVNHYNSIMEEYIMDETEAVVEPETETVAKTESKGNDNIMAAVAYLLAPIAGIILYLIEKDKPDKRRFVMFHAVQSSILGIALLVICIILLVINIIPILGTIISLLGFLVLAPGALIILIFMMYKSYSGEEYHLPVIGDYTEKYI